MKRRYFLQSHKVCLCTQTKSAHRFYFDSFVLTLVSMSDLFSVHNENRTMVNIVSSPRGSLSPQLALKLANVYLENASTCNIDDRDIALVLCHDTEMSLSQAKKSIRRPEDQYVNVEIATAYMDLGNLLESQGHLNEAKASYKKAEKLGYVSDRPLHQLTSRITGKSTPIDLCLHSV